MQASVPLLVNLTISIDGTASTIILANSFSKTQGAPKLQQEIKEIQRHTPNLVPLERVFLTAFKTSGFA
jgi:hypothetical protein